MTFRCGFDSLNAFIWIHLMMYAEPYRLIQLDEAYFQSLIDLNESVDSADGFLIVIPEDIALPKAGTTRRQRYPGICTLPGKNHCLPRLCDCPTLDGIMNDAFDGFSPYVSVETYSPSSKKETRKWLQRYKSPVPGFCTLPGHTECLDSLCDCQEIMLAWQKMKAIRKKIRLGLKLNSIEAADKAVPTRDTSMP